MARFIQKAATILAGQSISDVVDCATGAPVMIFMPNQWTPARLTFQVSPDGTNYYNLFDNNAREVQFNVRAGTVLRLDDVWMPVLFMKVRSGSCDLLVPQAADRQVIVTIDTSAA